MDESHESVLSHAEISSNNLNIQSFMKRRKKKLFTGGKTISVPKKPLTAYAIFVKKMRSDYQRMLKSGEMASEVTDENGNGRFFNGV